MLQNFSIFNIMVHISKSWFIQMMVSALAKIWIFLERKTASGWSCCDPEKDWIQERHFQIIPFSIQLENSAHSTIYRTSKNRSLLQLRTDLTGWVISHKQLCTAFWPPKIKLLKAMGLHSRRRINKRFESHLICVIRPRKL